jgi:flagellar motor switch protein FliM
MADNSILSQDEIDALLSGMDGGEVEAIEEPPAAVDGALAYDFRSQDRIIRGSLPTLEMVNERFARNFRQSLFGLLRRSPEIAVGGIQMLKFSEYVHGLSVPASMNMVKVPPLRGVALFTFDPKLVFALVDNFFGGCGHSASRIEGRDFTATERRVVHMVLERAFADLRKAWETVLGVDFKYLGTEVNPQFANVVSPSAVIVVTIFDIEFEGGGGGLHLAFPYSMIEPIRELLDTGMQSDTMESDERWSRTLRAEVELAEVELRSTLATTHITLRELKDLEAGAIIPVELPETVLAAVDGVVVFSARFGKSNGNLALKVVDVAGHAERVPTVHEGGKR